LKGFLNTEIFGALRSNGEKGVYGITAEKSSENRYIVAQKQEIKVGKAQIMTTLPCKETKLYSCEIEKINYNEKNLTRNLIIKITDPELLQIAGGIVQGMSGSPIIQNGKFVGAVTHVFVNNPCLGYGIFAENMLAEAERYTEKNRAAS
ncbi:MAG: SpoIVB peptidase, partial [Clostridia bacterium]|nr:SpoIVB peptidase [Clostridia bacterium]